MLQTYRSSQHATMKTFFNAVFPASRACYPCLTTQPFLIYYIYLTTGIHLQNCKCIWTRLFKFFSKRLLYWEMHYVILPTRHANTSKLLKLTRNTKPEPVLLLSESRKSLLQVCLLLLYLLSALHHPRPIIYSWHFIHPWPIRCSRRFIHPHPIYSRCIYKCSSSSSCLTEHICSTTIGQLG